MTREKFIDFTKDHIIYLDGATGSNLVKAGMPSGVCPEQWILEHPQTMIDLQRAYVEAGTQILLAPTFTANRIKLEEYGLADKLVESFGRDEVSILRHDNYYKRHDDIPFEERAKLNYDHPDAFDTDLLCQHILELKAGKSIEMPVYDYAMHNRSDKTILVHPAPVIVLEGILLFVEKDLCDLMDIKVFVDTDADVRILRRILRDVKERGRSLDSVVTQYLTTVKPMHEQFVEPTRKFADIIVLEGGHNLVALDMIMQRIAGHIKEN